MHPSYPGLGLAVLGRRFQSSQLIFPAYDRLSETGLLGKKPPTKPNFFAARILADEALASKVRSGAMGGWWRGGGERDGDHVLRSIP